MDSKIQLSFHVDVIPCPEEYGMGCSAGHEAYNIEIPEELIPIRLLLILQGRNPNKRLTNIAIVKQ